MNSLLGLAAFGGVFAIIASMWTKIRDWFLKVTSLLILRVELEDTLGNAVGGYVHKHCKPSRLGVRSYTAGNMYIRPIRRFGLVVFEMLSGVSRTFWYKGWPIWVKANMDKDQDYRLDKITLVCIRGTVNVEDFLKVCVDDYTHIFQSASEEGRNFRIIKITGRGLAGAFSDRRDVADGSYRPRSGNMGLLTQGRPVHYEVDELGGTSQRQLLDNMIIPPEAEQAVKQVKYWKQNREWFEDRGLPWTRGWLLTGPPGTGKTSLARAMAQSLDIPVFSYDLASMNNDELVSEWTQMLSMTPCVALFEDLDVVFKGRKNQIKENTMDTGVTFNCLLNCLDGIEESDGVFKVITTNHLEDFDEALTKRPGRIDTVLELGYIDSEGCRKMAERILSGHPDKIEVVIQNFSGAVDLTPAAFQEECFTLAYDALEEQLVS